MVQVSEEYIKEVLREYTDRRKEIQKRILAIYDELQDSDALIRSISIKKLEWDKVGHQQGEISDLGDIMLQHQQLARQQTLELRQELQRLKNEDEVMNRIWVCYRSLSGKKASYLEHLYVRGLPYKAVEQASGVSHRTFEKTRRTGLRQIQKLCESSMTNLQIINLSHYQEQKAKEEKKEGYEQLTLNL